MLENNLLHLLPLHNMDPFESSKRVGMAMNGCCLQNIKIRRFLLKGRCILNLLHIGKIPSKSDLSESLGIGGFGHVLGKAWLLKPLKE